MKFLRSLFVLLLSAAWVPSPGQTTLGECLTLARENYPAIKRYGLVVESRRMNLSNAAKGYLPQFSITGIAGLIEGMPEIGMPGAASASKGVNNQFIGIAQLNQPVWDGGLSRARKAVAEASADVDVRQIEVELYEVSERICNLFFGLLITDSSLQSLDLTDRTLAANISRVETAIRNGAARGSDLDALKAERLVLKQRRIGLEAQRKAYNDMLCYMTGRLSSERINPVVPPETSPRNGIDRPEQALFEGQRRLYDAQRRMIASQSMPRILLMGIGVGMTPGVKLGTSKLNHLLLAGINVSWSIGGIYTRKNDLGLLGTAASVASSSEETFLFNTNLQMTKADNEISRTRAILAQDDEIIALRESIRRDTELKLANGTATPSDLVRDINAEGAARSDRELHRMQYLMNIYLHKIVTGDKIE